MSFATATARKISCSESSHNPCLRRTRSAYRVCAQAAMTLCTAVKIVHVLTICISWTVMSMSIVDACTVNAFKARLDKFWQHQLVKFDFTADLTGTGNRSEEVIK